MVPTNPEIPEITNYIWEAIAEKNRVSIIVTNIKHMVLYISTAAEETLGYNFNEIKGRSLHSIFDFSSAADSEVFTANDQDIQIPEYENTDSNPNWPEGTYLNNIICQQTNGKSLTLSLKISPLYDENEQLFGYLHILKNSRDGLINDHKCFTYFQNNDSIEIDPERLRITDIISLDSLQKLQDGFAKVHGVGALLFDTNGKPINKYSNFAKFCTLVRRTDKGLQRCMISDRRMSEKIKRGGYGMVPCKNIEAIMDGAFPIIIQGHHIANWGIGQVLHQPVDENEVRELAKDIGVDEQQLVEASRELKQMSRKDFEELIELMHMITSWISNTGLLNLKQNHLLKEKEELETKLLNYNLHLEDIVKKRTYKLEQEVRERIEIQKLVKKNELHLKKILDSSPDVIIELTPDLQVKWANETAKKINSRIIGNTCYKAFTKRDTPCEGCTCLKALKSGNIEKGTMHQPVMENMKGECYWENIIVPLKEEDGSIYELIAISRNITERKITEKRIEYLTSVLNSIRSVDQIITKEKDVFELLTSICKILTDGRGYHNAWICLMDREANINAIRGSGLDQYLKALHLFTKEGNIPHCVKRAFGESGAFFISNPVEECANCPLSNNYQECGALISKLEYDNVIYGVISTSIPLEFIDDQEVLELFSETASDIAWALHNLELEASREIAEMAMLESKIAAEEANRTKTQFLANMSHELRTPLNSIIGFSQILAMNKYDNLNEKEINYADNVLKSGEHLLNLINNILDISKVENGKMELYITSFDMIKTINEVIELTVPMATSRNIKLITDFPQTNLFIYADQAKVKDILYNLLSNAIKFTRENGHIWVDCKCQENNMIINVTDDGIGIAEDKIQSIFEPFKQVDSAQNRKYQGTGLGLALVKQYIKMHKGHIDVTSEEGKGTTFTFTLPIDKLCEEV